MKLNKVLIASIFVILLVFVVALIFYSKLPQKIATHWDEKGEVNGYMSRFWGAFIIPFLLVGLFLLFLAIPYIDPLGKNIQAFKNYYDIFILLFVIFMASVQMQTLLWNVGVKINPLIFVSVGSGLLFYYIGVLLKNAKRNWFIGIRTPWTLSSDAVWEKTHNLGSILFKISGILCLVGFFFQKFEIYFVILPLSFTAVYTVIYSYIAYRKEVSNGNRK